MATRIGGTTSPTAPSALPTAPTAEAPKPSAVENDPLGDGYSRSEPRSRLDPEEPPTGGFMETVRRHPRLAASALAAASVVPAAVAHAETNEIPPPTVPNNTDLSESILFGDNQGDGRLVRLLKSVVRSEVYKNRDITVASMSGEYAGVRVAAKAKLISPTDPLIAKHSVRAAATKASIDAGQPITWAVSGGGIYPSLHAGFGVPAGPVRIHLGANARASLDYSVLAPYTLQPSAVVDAAKNLTTRLPLGAESARELAGGTEVTLRGTGHVAVYGGATFSENIVEAPGISVGVSAGVNHTSAKDIGLSMLVERLDGDKVRVGLDAWDATTNTESGHLAVGVDSHVGELVNLGESSGSVGAATDALTNLLDKQIERWLKVELRGTHTEWAVKDNQGRYVIDLGKPGGREAYDALMQRFLALTGAKSADVAAPLGDGVAAVRTWLATPLTSASLSDVRSATLTESRKGNSDSLTMHFGPIELLSSVSSAEAKHGTLTTPEGVITYDRAKLTDAHSDIITRWWNGKRTTLREYVSATFPGQPESSYYHARHTVKSDSITSKNDVRRFVALADILGALPSEAKGLESDKTFLSRFDSSDRVIDIFLTKAGFEKLTAATDGEIHAAFASSYERLDRPWKMDYLWGNDSVWRTTPWLATDHPKHDRLVWLLERGPEPQSNNNGRGSGNTRDSEYRYVTGRSLSEDSAAYKEAKNLVSLVGKLRAASGPAERADILAKAEEDLDLDVAKELATFAKIAGPEDVLVKDMRIVDNTNKKHFVLVSEGEVTDPAGLIASSLANP